MPEAETLTTAEAVLSIVASTLAIAQFTLQKKSEFACTWRVHDTQSGRLAASDPSGASEPAAPAAPATSLPGHSRIPTLPEPLEVA